MKRVMLAIGTGLWYLAGSALWALWFYIFVVLFLSMD
jgi:hypothetical protein